MLDGLRILDAVICRDRCDFQIGPQSQWKVGFLFGRVAGRVQLLEPLAQIRPGWLSTVNLLESLLEAHRRTRNLSTAERTGGDRPENGQGASLGRSSRPHRPVLRRRDNRACSRTLKPARGSRESAAHGARTVARKSRCRRARCHIGKRSDRIAGGWQRDRLILSRR